MIMTIKSEKPLQILFVASPYYIHCIKRYDMSDDVTMPDNIIWLPYEIASDIKIYGQKPRYIYITGRKEHRRKQFEFVYLSSMPMKESRHKRRPVNLIKIFLESIQQT